MRDAPPDASLPSWLAEAARAGWGTDLAGRRPVPAVTSH